MSNASALDRFEAKYRIDPETGCWLWTAARSHDGYGHFWSGTRVTFAHKWMWEYLNGPVPEGMQLDHFECDGGAQGCVNPQHVRLASPWENGLRSRGFPAVNRAKTHCHRGHPFDQANTYVNPQGSRVCRTCRHDRDSRVTRAAGWARWRKLLPTP